MSSSAQQIIISTFLEEPFAAWLGGEIEGLQDCQTAKDYEAIHATQLEDLEGWAFGAPLNEEFFQAVAAYQPTEDPGSGEAWVFLPMYDPIDVRGMSSVTVSFEMFIKDLLEVYEADPAAPGYEGSDDSFRDGADRIHVLSSGKSYTDDDGNIYYAPLLQCAPTIRSHDRGPATEDNQFLTA